MKKTLCLLLALLTLVVFVACATPGNDDPADTTTTPSNTPSGSDSSSQDPNSQTTPAETTAPEEADELGNVRFDGQEYDILSRKLTSYEVLSEEITGDLIADAVFQRNITIEDRFGVKVNVIEEPGNWDDKNTFMAKVTNSVLSGDHDYDLVMTHSAYIVNLAVQGRGYDMYELDGIDFSKKWWCQKYVDNASMLGHAYTAMGDIGYTIYEYMECVFFNKGLADDVGVPDLYPIVESGEWTYDKLKQYSLLLGDDLDANGVHDRNDLYGLGVNGHCCRMTATFWDAQMTVVGDNGRHTINLPNEKYLAIYDELYSLVYGNPENVFFVTEGAKIETEMFMNNQLMFFVEKLGNAVTMKDSDVEYGIVPFPKYDSNQENYISSARDALSAILVVSNIESPEMVGTITEAMCMLGYQQITPVYYETSLKYKYLNDPSAMKMLDLIRDTMTFDFAATYTNSLNLIYSVLGDNIKNNVSSISALVKGSKKVWQNGIDQLYAAFEQIDK